MQTPVRTSFSTLGSDPFCHDRALWIESASCGLALIAKSHIPAAGRINQRVPDPPFSTALALCGIGYIFQSLRQVNYTLRNL